MNAATLSALNPGLRVLLADAPEFSRYGRSLTLPGLPERSEELAALIPLDLSANRYVASWPALEALPDQRSYSRTFGFVPVQTGFVAGPNSSLNGFEYHKSSEIDVALTDQALLLGLWEEMDDMFRFDANRTVCLFMPKGSAVELYPRVLHYSPCKTDDGGFKTIIVLPKGTNDALGDAGRGGFSGDGDTGGRVGEERLLFMRNKWLIAHPERTPLMERGAYPGVIGPNLIVRY